MNTYTITLSEDHLRVINSALSNGPYGAVAPVVAHINAEIQRLYNERYDKQREAKPTASYPQQPA
jgi:hypothetical protein